MPKSIASIKHYYRSIATESLPYHWLQSWLLTVINQPSSFLITDGDYVLNDDEWRRFNDGVDQMLSGIPLAYLTGVQAFFGRDFLVNQHTLIPRPDTEILVQSVLDFIKDNKRANSAKILDLGTGSGCIAITIAKELPNADLLGVDFCENALMVAKMNAKTLGVDNCRFMQSDWFGAILPSSQFDVIVSNPPYISKTDTHLHTLTAEPVTALVADDDGLADICLIAQQSAQHLFTGGLLAIEHGYNQGACVREIFENNGYQQVRTIQDYGSNDRVTLGVLHP
ncbi:peptide chain release factor N(5)-glutamine methyltransferase [Moraxella nasovis]|uniref:peptide chain release factor N(5)-glutamine methyltransferase n=1 Tax=Moraxella nasovis TaxID=2904121 RepID=UPI001F6240B9|nr:peptide chain release factor N(5)-glutamine methyltransferase [Moraxella nasovis]UNU73395.1 peptide chain release factor N(5)-glutamine methyltransferase [Moraxella nasovis]